jgi:hypothetical protein
MRGRGRKEGLGPVLCGFQQHAEAEARRGNGTCNISFGSSQEDTIGLLFAFAINHWPERRKQKMLVA